MGILSVKKCFERHKCWAIFVLKKVLRATQKLNNIRVEKSASSDTNVGQYSCWKKCFERYKCWAIFVLKKIASIGDFGVPSIMSFGEWGPADR